MQAISGISGIRIVFTGFAVVVMVLFTVPADASSCFSKSSSCITISQQTSNSAGTPSLTFNEADPLDDDVFTMSPLLIPIKEYFSNQPGILPVRPVFSFTGACWQPPEIS